MFSPKISRWINRWNRKIHIYLGLCLLWFLWVFSISGLLLNHPDWQFADFWPDRRQSSLEQAIQMPLETEDLARARNLMRQLGISGEIEWTVTHPGVGRFDFRVVKPGQIIEVKSDLKLNRASMQRIKTNGWGFLKMLHTFTGVRLGDPRAQRDWWVTRFWSLSMDAVALGLIALLLSGFYQWFQSRRAMILGSICFGLGIASCAFFLVGLDWF